jgi:hypothetical protein
MHFTRNWTVFFGIGCLAWLSSCSTDMRGLGDMDTGGSGAGGAGRTGGAMGSGGTMAPGTGGIFASGGMTGSGGESATGGTGTAGETVSGGATGMATGGSGTGTGGLGTGGSAIGGRPGTGGSASGGAGTGGRHGTGGAATGGRMGTGGNATGGSGTGDAGTGGAATGGAGTGGAGTGGAATGGAGTGGAGTGGAVNKPECTTASDCRLVSDCCTCRAGPVAAPNPQPCPLLCIQSKCNQEMLPSGAVDCVAGRCVAGFNCDASTVVCGGPTPACAPGEVPTVNPSGTCYSGGCVPATQCKRVTSCADCSADQACVNNVTFQGNQAHCVTIPTTCQGTATCACLGASSCVSPYTICADFSGLKGIACGCPSC